MGGVAHFEIQVDDVERAKAFYGDVFGWTYAKFPGGDFEYWLINVGDQTQGGGILPRNAPASPAGTCPTAFVCTMNVDSVDQSVQKALNAGGTLARPKNHIPGMGWVAYLLDPDGNQFGVFQADMSAQQNG